jgi:hypothetical protein
MSLPRSQSAKTIDQSVESVAGQVANSDGAGVAKESHSQKLNQCQRRQRVRTVACYPLLSRCCARIRLRAPSSRLGRPCQLDNRVRLLVAVTRAALIWEDSQSRQASAAVPHCVLRPCPCLAIGPDNRPAPVRRHHHIRQMFVSRDGAAYCFRSRRMAGSHCLRRNTHFPGSPTFSTAPPLSAQSLKPPRL